MERPLLLLETSGAHCSVAVAAVDGGSSRVLAEAEHTIEMEHTAMLVPLIHSAFAKTDFALPDVAAVAVSTGPGSYTALRSGMSTAKGICLALEIPLLTVSTLRAFASIAQETFRIKDATFLALIEARKQEIYYAVYDESLNEIVSPVVAEADLTWKNTLTLHENLCAVGSGVEKIQGLYPALASYHNFPLRARNLLKISAQKLTTGDFADLGQAVPSYIKKPFITKAKPRL